MGALTPQQARWSFARAADMPGARHYVRRDGVEMYAGAEWRLSGAMLRCSCIAIKLRSFVATQRTRSEPRRRVRITLTMRLFRINLLLAGRHVRGVEWRMRAECSEAARCGGVGVSENEDAR